MSADLDKQKFLAELESIVEDDEAYGSNISVLNYTIKDGVIAGKFRDSWNNRVYEFEIDSNSISYKPAINLDSANLDSESARQFDLYSNGYNSLFADRQDGKLTGKRVKKPKCGSTAYGCGFSCIGLKKTCRILGRAGKKAGTNQGSAIGKERLTKLIDLATKLFDAKDKKGYEEVSKVGYNVAIARGKITGARQARLRERQVDRELKSIEETTQKAREARLNATKKQKANEATGKAKSTPDDDDIGNLLDDLLNDKNNPTPDDDIGDLLDDFVNFKPSAPSEGIRQKIRSGLEKKNKSQSRSSSNIGKPRISNPEQVTNEQSFNKYRKTLLSSVAYYESQGASPRDEAYKKVLDEVDKVFAWELRKPKPPKIDKNPRSNRVIHEENKTQIKYWNESATRYHENIKKLFPNYDPGNYKKEAPKMKDDPWEDFANAMNARMGGASKPWQDVLGVSGKSSNDKKQVTKRYRDLAREFHPDTTKMADKKKAAEKFMEIQKAYEQYIEQKGGRRDSIFNSSFPNFTEIASYCNSVMSD